ncbi:unnamed protein product, partial [marine sediment metagenome]
DGSNPTFKICVITDCTASGGDGGGVYCGAGNAVEFADCTFNNNTATYDGGGIYCGVGNSAEFTDCELRNNTATFDGGGLYYGSEGNSILTRCAFSGNRAEYGAGIFYNVNCGLSKLTECSFIDNDANEDGGGVLFGVNNLIMVSDCNFTNNLAQKGAGLYFDPNCGGEIKLSELVGNDANEDGGAIYIGDCNDIEVNDCDISYNTAHHGGGLFCLWSPGSRIIACTIKYNDAAPGLAQGGGIYSFAGPKLIKDCDISYNTSRTSGGGVYLIGDDDPAFPLGP